MKKLQMNKLINIINTSLNKSIQSSPLKTNLEESMKYSLNAGGKRIRPVILLLTLKMLNKDYQQGLNSALALEMIHTYSLIHDDLPAMDNDDYRRGELTNHKVYGDESKLGKKVGSDIVNHKSTYVSLLGKDGAEEKLNNHQCLALNCLNQISDQYDTSELSDIVDLFYNRDH
ncbi:MAG: polyprenyl synthetase family protein [Staphylococcus epidermidis]|nr:polyprenyl synthetase family protein [Staphylococcus epidermidis]